MTHTSPNPGHRGHLARMESSYIAFGSARRPWLCAPCLWLAPIGLVAVLGAAAMHMHSSEERERTALAAVPTTRPEGVCAANSLPHKYSLSHVTPVELQMERGATTLCDEAHDDQIVLLCSAHAVGPGLQLELGADGDAWEMQYRNRFDKAFDPPEPPEPPTSFQWP